MKTDKRRDVMNGINASTIMRKQTYAMAFEEELCLKKEECGL